MDILYEVYFVVIVTVNYDYLKKDENLNSKDLNAAVIGDDRHLIIDYVSQFQMIFVSLGNV